MKHSDRVLTALNHEEPDRCPMQISFTPEFASRLRANLQQRNAASHNPHGGGNTYELERALGQDMLLTSVGWANSYYMEGGNYTDEWGVGWRQCEYTTRYGRGCYTEIASHPFADECWIVGVTVTTIFECSWAPRRRLECKTVIAKEPAECILLWSKMTIRKP